MRPRWRAIDEARACAPDVPHVAVFDTAFHATIPEVVHLRAAPPLARGVGHPPLRLPRPLRRLGGRAGAGPATRCLPSRRRLLGDGRPGRPLGRHDDGLQPARGRPDGDASGTIDPEILLYLQRHEHATPRGARAGAGARVGPARPRRLGAGRGARGLLGAGEPGWRCRSSATASPQPWPRWRLRSAVSTALVFTAGVGEGSALVRARVCERLGFLGIELDLGRTVGGTRRGRSRPPAHPCGSGSCARGRTSSPRAPRADRLGLRASPAALGQPLGDSPRARLRDGCDRDRRARGGLEHERRVAVEPLSRRTPECTPARPSYGISSETGADPARPSRRRACGSSSSFPRARGSRPRARRRRRSFAWLEVSARGALAPSGQARIGLRETRSLRSRGQRLCRSRSAALPRAVATGARRPGGGGRLTQPSVGRPVLTWKKIPEPRPGTTGSCCRRSPQSGGRRSASATSPRWSCGTAATSRSGRGGSGCSKATPGPRPTSRRTPPGDSGSGRRAGRDAVHRWEEAEDPRRRAAVALAFRRRGAAPPEPGRPGPRGLRQQAPRFVHSRSEPCVEARVRATTVTSCVAEPVSSRPAKVGAQAGALVVRRGRGGDGERDEGEGEQPHRPADYGGWPRSCSWWSRSRRRRSRTRSHG